jgi:hypothetical protein
MCGMLDLAVGQRVTVSKASVARFDHVEGVGTGLGGADSSISVLLSDSPPSHSATSVLGQNATAYHLVKLAPSNSVARALAS